MNDKVETPYFIMHQEKLDSNLERLKKLETLANVKVLHTLKSFNESTVTPLISKKISGMSISSKKELKMAQKASAKHIHLYAPAYKEKELKSIVKDVDTLSFNSLGQWHKFKGLKAVSKGLRINPKLALEIPQHCNPNLEYSHLGVDTLAFLNAFENEPQSFQSLEGLHFHALFQSSVEGLILLLDYILKHYAGLLPQLKWLNLGGGHQLTELDYDLDTFVNHLRNFQTLYPNITFYFEPGEAVTKACGEFVTTVLDIVNIAGQEVAILDTSIETHLLDIAIVNIKLKVKGTQLKLTDYSYKLTGNSCLQGDNIGQYFFTKALEIGDSIIFEDMMPYTMVKMTEFNGMEKAKFYHQ